MNVHALHHTVDAETLIRSGMALAADPATSHAALDRLVDRILQLEASSTSPGFDGRCLGVIDAVLSDVFERGWRPFELVHVMKRQVDKPGLQMMRAMIGSHSRRTVALSTAPSDWRDQLRELRIDPSTDLVQHRRSARIHPRTFWTSLFRLLVHLRQLQAITGVTPPPSRWGTVAATQPAPGADLKILNRIRGLLAKAESSTFAEESDTLSAKAQELMTRYAIDSAVLGAAQASTFDAMVATRRLVVDNPYADAKMALLSGVARSNGAKTVRYKRFGLISITGMPVDLDLCELLYTSLLVQSARALDVAGTDSATRTRGFRRAFLFGYAWRVAERLAEARARADRAAGATYGSALVPVLAERDRAVEAVFQELFPNLATSKISVSDDAGIHRGRLAAERADLTGGREQID